MVPNRLNRENENEREVEFRPLSLFRSFGSNGLEPYAPLLVVTCNSTVTFKNLRKIQVTQHTLSGAHQNLQPGHRVEM